MKTTQYAVKVKTFYKIIIADIVQYFDFIKIVFRACLHSVLSRDGNESHMNSKLLQYQIHHSVTEKKWGGSAHI